MEKHTSEDIQGTFYEQKLEKPKQIQKIIQRRDNKFLVKWVGYPASFNSWVDVESVMK